MSRQGVPGAHSLTFCLGRSMCQQYCSWLKEPVQDSAVYCCVKAFVRSEDLQQAPEVILDGPTHLSGSEPSQVLRSEALSQKEISDAMFLEDLCRFKYSKLEAARALSDFVRKRRYELEPLEWLKSPLMKAAPHESTGCPYFPQLPQTAWKLVARKVNLQ